jgi:hypothetical protein
MRLTKILMAGAACLALAACGSAEVASPGEGNFGGGTGGGTGGGGGGGGGGTTPATCPTGTANVGTITAAGGAVLRNCQLPNLIVGGLSLDNLAGVIYSVSGRVDVDSDRRAGRPRLRLGRPGLHRRQPRLADFRRRHGDRSGHLHQPPVDRRHHRRRFDRPVGRPGPAGPRADRGLPGRRDPAEHRL